MQVKFLDLSFITREIKEDYLKAVEKILDRTHFILTEEVLEFESHWAKTIGTKYSVGTACGADALYLSLVALNIGSGDEVIIQGNAYNASVTAILRVGATPVFVDINPKTWEMDVSKLEAAITKKTKAILPVHMYGLPNDMQAIMALAEKHHLFVVEDCAQAHLAEAGTRKVGSFGQANAFSFYPTKNLGAFGDAGAVTTNNEEIYKKLLALRHLGQVAKNDHRYLGYNMRLDPLQASALSLKLRFLKKWTKQRVGLADYYKELIGQMSVPVKFQVFPSNISHVYHLFAVLLPEKASRGKIQRELLNLGVETAVHYPLPVYKQPFYEALSKISVVCPNTEKLCAGILSLPLYIGLTKAEQEYVIRSLKKVLKNYV